MTQNQSKCCNMYYFHEFCFLCLTNRENIINIGSSDSNGAIIRQKIDCFLPEYKILKSDIPKYVCTECELNIGNPTFRQTFVENICFINDYLQIRITKDVSYDFLTTKLTDILQYKVDKTLQEFCNREKIKNADNSERNCTIKIENTQDVIKNEELIIKEDEETQQINLKRYNCDECSKLFQYKYQLERHSRVHTGERPFECPICHKTFANPGNLCTHKKTHTGARPHICEFCNKGFTTPHSLQTHKRTHTKERPFQCTICAKRFADYSHFAKHKIIHSVDKPYQCQFCQYKCKRTDSLKLHLRLHTGEKPYKCKLCDRAFTVSSHLTRHVKFVHGLKNSAEKQAEALLE